MKGMDKMNNKLLIMGGCFIIILIFGFVLSRTGKPYNSLLLNVHKLVSLGAFVYLVVTLVQFNRLVPLGTLEWIVFAACCVFFVSLIVTGGLMSALKNPPEFLHTIHQIAPYLAILSTAGTLYLLLVHKQ